VTSINCSGLRIHPAASFIMMLWQAALPQWHAAPIQGPREGTCCCHLPPGESSDCARLLAEAEMAGASGSWLSLALINAMLDRNIVRKVRPIVRHLRVVINILRRPVLDSLIKKRGSLHLHLKD
jgi:hypothetical protein